MHSSYRILDFDIQTVFHLEAAVSSVTTQFSSTTTVTEAQSIWDLLCQSAHTQKEEDRQDPIWVSMHKVWSVVHALLWAAYITFLKFFSTNPSVRTSLFTALWQHCFSSLDSRHTYSIFVFSWTHWFLILNQLNLVTIFDCTWRPVKIRKIRPMMD